MPIPIFETKGHGGIGCQWIGVAGLFPSQIWGFFEVKGLDEGQIIHLPHYLSDGTDVYNGTFAIIESAEYMDNNESDSLFRDIKLEANEKLPDGTVLKRKFFLVDVEAFKDLLVVIPNLGTTDRYLETIPRTKWSALCHHWILAPHEPIPSDNDGASI